MRNLIWPERFKSPKMYIFKFFGKLKILLGQSLGQYEDNCLKFHVHT